MKKPLGLSFLLLICLIFLIAVLVFDGLSAQSNQGPPKFDFDMELLTGEHYLPAEPRGEPIASDPASVDNYFQFSKITFMSIRDGNWEIYSSDGQGSNLKRLTNHGAVDAYPRSNQGATRIVFASNRSGNFEIYTMKYDGKNVQRLTYNNSDDTNPSWSFDGLKIVFESDRDGQMEIYSMNVNGSGQKRLTSNSAFDGDPSWSPDSSQIVFSSHRNGYGIWVMNADGSNPHQISNKFLCQNPVWSPDGTKIAFDADDNGDGWQEIWLMFPNGSIRNRIYAPIGQIDPYVRAWSPDGRYISFTRTEWVLYKGDWYWTKAVPYRIAYSSKDYEPISFGWDREWYPDWQVTDIIPPTSVVEPLPAYSGDDALVRWSGTDQGGSGILSYDVYYRIGTEGNWQTFAYDTVNTANIFGKRPGETVYFRSRARDNAHQLEEWPAGNGDAHTTFYNWKISGKASDNRLVPLPGVSVTTTQQMFDYNSSDENGHYGAYFDGYESAFQIDFLRADFGTLPTTEFASAKDGDLDILLPPIDNVIVDPGFEAASFPAGNWQTGGTYTPVLTSTQRHTGEQAVFFGRHFGIEPLAKFDAEVVFNPKTSPRQDATGRFHAVWYEDHSAGGRTILYAYGDQDGNWSEPIATTPLNTDISDLHWDVSPDGRVHIIWKVYKDAYDVIYHTWMDSSGWHDPEIVYSIGRSRLYAFRLDSQGNGHLLWHLDSSGLSDYFYSHVNSIGTWSAPDRLFAQYDHEAYNLIIDHDDGLHLQWNYSGDDLFHNYRLPNGSWSALEKIAPGGYNWHNDLLIDDNNGVHLVWGNVSSDKIFHSKRQADGSWSPPTYLSDGTAPDTGSLKAIPGPGGTLVIVWKGSGHSCRQIYRAQIDSSGDWTGTDRLDTGNDCVNRFWLRRRGQQVIALAEEKYNDVHHFCQLPLVPGAINSAGECTFLPTEIYGHEYPHPLIGLDGLNHIFWRLVGTDGKRELLHSRSRVNDIVGKSQLWQTVTIPANMLYPTLSFVYWQGLNAPDEDLNLLVSIEDGLQTTPVFTGTQTEGWSYQWVDMEPWGGQEVDVIFSLKQGVGTAASWIYLDEVSLGSAYPDIWAVIEDPPTVAPGTKLQLILHYGNKSSAAALDNQLTATLPDELAIIEAIPSPTSQNGQMLVWDLGALTSTNSPGTITVTVDVSPALPGGISLPVSVDLDGDTPELIMDNNSYQVMVDISRRIFVPTFRR